MSEQRKNRAGPAMTGSDKKTICTFVMSDVSRYNEVRKQMEVLEMFRHKKEKRIVELNSEQLRLDRAGQAHGGCKRAASENHEIIL